MFNFATTTAATKKKELEDRYAAAREKITAEELANEKFESQLAKRQLDVEGLEDSLLLAAGRKQYLQQRINQLLETAASLWHQPEADSMHHSQSPVNLLCDCHISILAMRSALETYPQVEEQLKTQLTQAKAMLSEFSKQRPK